MKHINLKEKYHFVDDENIVLGNIIASPDLISQEEIKSNYFTSDFRIRMFEVIQNLSKMDDTITREGIASYLTNRNETKAIFSAANWEKWFEIQTQKLNKVSFKRSYARIKKVKYLRDLKNILGEESVREFYDPDLLDTKAREETLDYFDSLTIEDIQEAIGRKVNNVAIENSVSNVCGNSEAVDIGSVIQEIFDDVDGESSYGMPFFDSYHNTLYRGMRESCFYLRSAATNVGKSRSLLGDATNLATPQLWVNGEWVDNGEPVPVLFISTEQRQKEISGMVASFISGVNNRHITTKEYDFGELERAKKAASILGENPETFQFVSLSDFTLNDMRKKIVDCLVKYKTKYIFYDYLHTTPAMLSRFTKDTRVAMREDQILGMFSNELKSIAIEYNVFVISATQLNRSFKESDNFPDESCIRGSFAIADKADTGEILLEPTQEDYKQLNTFLRNSGMPKPNIKVAVYKNRGDPYKNMYLWQYADKGTCRFQTLFATDENYNVLTDFQPTILKKGE